MNLIISLILSRLFFLYFLMIFWVSTLLDIELLIYFSLRLTVVSYHKHQGITGSPTRNRPSPRPQLVHIHTGLLVGGAPVAMRIATLAIADEKSTNENGLINTLSAPASKNSLTSDSKAFPVRAKREG